MLLSRRLFTSQKFPLAFGMEVVNDCSTSKVALRAADWGYKMSVCIGVLCEGRKKIVIVTDEKVTFGNFSADHAVIKLEAVHSRFLVLYAGNDVEHAQPVIARANQILLAKNPEGALDGQTIAAAFDDAYCERLHIQINNKILRKRGFTVDTFRDTGKQKCQPSAYLSLCDRIDKLNISLSFLLCGLDPDGSAGLWVVDGENAPQNYSNVGMWAIGSGAYAAMSSLAFRTEHQHLSVLSSSAEEACYFAMEAKFMAESSGEVGREGMFVAIMDGTTSLSSITDANAKEIKDKLWGQEATPRVPTNLKQRIAERLFKVSPESAAAGKQ